MTTTVSPKPQSPKRDGVVVPHKPKWHQHLAAALIYGRVRAVSATVRYEWRDESGLLIQPHLQPLIFVVWHNRLALCLDVYHRYNRRMRRAGRMAAMVSASKDGGLLARVLELNSVEPVRGSTSRRGRQALLELVTWAERGHDLAITPDGPRGPCYKVQDGVISLAQLTGFAIVPFSFRHGWKLRLKSWDRFQIPMPFTKCEVAIGKLVVVPREASDEEREILRKTLEDRLQSITRDS